MKRILVNSSMCLTGMYVYVRVVQVRPRRRGSKEKFLRPTGNLQSLTQTNVGSIFESRPDSNILHQNLSSTKCFDEAGRKMFYSQLLQLIYLLKSIKLGYIFQAYPNIYLTRNGKAKTSIDLKIIVLHPKFYGRPKSKVKMGLTKTRRIFTDIIDISLVIIQHFLTMML